MDEFMESELADSKGRPNETHPDAEPKLIDVLASEARTALSDPAAIEVPRFFGTDEDYTVFAIERMDDIINLLNPSGELREDYARTLTALGRQIAERQDVIEASELSYEEHGPDTREAYETAHAALGRALDAIDEAINALTPDES